MIDQKKQKLKEYQERSLSVEKYPAEGHETVYGGRKKSWKLFLGW